MPERYPPFSSTACYEDARDAFRGVTSLSPFKGGEMAGRSQQRLVSCAIAAISFGVKPSLGGTTNGS